MRRALVLILLALGVVLLTGAVAETALTARYVGVAEQADGRVVAVESRQAGGSRSEVSLFPVVEYEAQGRTLRFRGEGSGGRDYRVGDEVEVLYLPDPPRDARITGVAAVWSRAAALLFAGVLFLLTGLLGRAMLAESRRDAEAEQA